MEKFPTLTFQSTKISLVKDGELAVEGDLTIRDVTRKVVFSAEGPTPPAKDPWGNTRVGVSATTKISRKDFGLSWNAALESGGFLVGDEVTITLDVQFIRLEFCFVDRQENVASRVFLAIERESYVTPPSETDH